MRLINKAKSLISHGRELSELLQCLRVQVHLLSIEMYLSALDSG